MTPTSELSIELNVDEKNLKNIHVTWNFSDLYSSEMLIQYDKNKNQALDKEELKVILDSMLDYLKPKEMLTKLTYSIDDNSSIIKPKYENFDIKMVDSLLVFSYDSITDVNIEENSTLSFLFEDDEGYFAFVITDLKIDNSELSFTKNLYLFTASIFFTPTQIQDVKKDEIQVAHEKNETKPQEIESVNEESIQENILKQSIVKIKSLFEDIKDEKNPLTYLFLLFFAYVYGLIHALGPGHGKTLVASYFLSNERSYSKALFISLAIGVVHTFSAFILTLIIYFVVETFLAQFMDDTILYTTKISALIIISIALYLFYQKHKAYKEIKKASSYSFSTIPHISTCSCSSCKVDTKSTDTALIISAGIIPCPGTVTIFIFSISLGLFYAGFLSALVMSLGMSTIIFLSALLSVAIRKKTSKDGGNLKKYLEYGSLWIILILGLVLLFT